MGTKTLLYKDSGGNTLWSEEIKTRGTKRLFAKNKQGKLIDKEGLSILAKRAGITRRRRLL